jgi:hypothetical protein
MCVIHSQKEMYSHLVELGVCEKAQNLDGHSCLLLAAMEGNHSMLNFILMRQQTVAWSYGPVTSYIKCMREVDTVQVRPPQVLCNDYPLSTQTGCTMPQDHLNIGPAHRTADQLVGVVWKGACAAVESICLFRVQGFFGR